MNMFNESENIEIHGGAFARVGGNVNQFNAQTVNFIQQGLALHSRQIHPYYSLVTHPDSQKRKRQPSFEEVIDSVDNPANSRSGSTRPHTKKGRMDGDKNSAQRISDSDKIMLSKLHAAKDAGRLVSKACLEGTRVELLERIRAWALDPTGERALILHGAAGM
ncbi:hypothetical protein H0H92_009285, partial [Tricholoma furcatifolium]